jgi:hypothetical protein
MKYNFNILFAITGYAPYLLLQADTERNGKHFCIDKVYDRAAVYIYGQSKYRDFFGNFRVSESKSQDVRQSIGLFGDNPESFGHNPELPEQSRRSFVQTPGSSVYTPDAFEQSPGTFEQSPGSFVQSLETRAGDSRLLNGVSSYSWKRAGFFMEDTCDSVQVNLTVNNNKIINYG